MAEERKAEEGEEGAEGGEGAAKVADEDEEQQRDEVAGEKRSARRHVVVPPHLALPADQRKASLQPHLALLEHPLRV